MARRTIVELVDDCTGGEATQTVSFALDGVAYEIDLGDDNATQLRSDFETWTDRARRVRGRRKRGGSVGRTSTPHNPKSAKIRRWALENGYEVSERGRLSASVEQAYDAAH